MLLEPAWRQLKWGIAARSQPYDGADLDFLRPHREPQRCPGELRKVPLDFWGPKHLRDWFKGIFKLFVDLECFSIEIYQ